MTEGFRGFRQPLEASARIVPQVTPPLILPRPLQFIIHLSSFIRRYIVLGSERAS
jgi:hypothetical protein